MSKQKISLKNDIIFKHFFKNNKKALISLLQSFLPLPKGRTIKDVMILDSLLGGKKLKESIMDLRLIMDNQELVNVEMQMCSHRFFRERLLFYWAKNYLSQLVFGAKYKKLQVTYSLIFCDFVLFKTHKEFYSSFSVRRDTKPHDRFSHHLQIVCVELKKFRRKLGDIAFLLDDREHWCYILKYLEEMGEQEWREFSSGNKTREEIMDWTKPLTKDQQQQLYRDALEKQRMDREALEDHFFEQGMEKVALNMLNEQADIFFISKVTGLSKKEIQKLEKES